MVAKKPMDFEIFAELSAFEKSGDKRSPMYIGGIVSTDDVDQDGEQILQEGLDFKPFLQRGWFNDNHSKSTVGIVGYPTDAFYVRKGQKLPNGRIAKSNGWWAEGYLLNTEEGRKIWGLVKALEDAPRKLGFSIEGKVLQRHPRDKSTVTKAVVRHVAVTHCPVNVGTELGSLVKALAAGHAIGSDDMSGPGNAAALRPESLDDTMYDQGYADDPTTTDAPHDTFDTDDDSGEVHKSEIDFELEPMDEVSWIADWAPAMSKVSPVPPGFTLDEARTIVKSEMPHLDEIEIDEIINRAIRGAE